MPYKAVEGAVRGAVALGTLGYNLYKSYSGANSAVSTDISTVAREASSTALAVYNPNKRKTIMIGSGNEFTRSKRRRRFGRNNIKKQIWTNKTMVVDRFQLLTNFDVDGGWQRISRCYRHNYADQYKMLPIHIYDLTSFNKAISADPVVGKVLLWRDATSTSNLEQYPIVGSDPHGNGRVTQWQSEESYANYIKEKVNLHWISIGMNLYGAKKRTTRFTVRIVQFKEENANFHRFTSTTHARNLVQALERPLLWSNLLPQEQDVINNNMRVLQTYNYVVGPTPTYEPNQAVGKIHEAKIFLKLNKCMVLDWHDSSDNLPHAEVPANQMAWDERREYADAKLGPVWGSRIYMIVTAFSPEAKECNDVGNWWRTEPDTLDPAACTPIDTNIEPSYDLIIKRKYSCHL